MKVPQAAEEKALRNVNKNADKKDDWNLTSF